MCVPPPAERMIVDHDQRCRTRGLESNNQTFPFGEKKD